MRGLSRAKRPREGGQLRAEGSRVFSAQCRGGSYHRPDLVVLGDPPEAVEVELTDKSAGRLDQLMRASRRSLAVGQFGRVRYLCSPQALSYVERAVTRTGTGWAVGVEMLKPRVDTSGSPWGSYQ